MEGKVHIMFLPFLGQGHLIPMCEMARAFSGRGVRATVVTTPANVGSIRRSIGEESEVEIQSMKFPYAEVGLPEGCENIESVPSQELLMPFFKATTMLQTPFESLIHQHRPHCLIAGAFFPWAADSAAKFNIPRFVFHGTSVFAQCASECMQIITIRRAWYIGPLSLCNQNQDKAKRGKQACVDEGEILKWLDSRKPNSVVYVCFGSIANFSESQLREIAKGLEWLPEGFERRTEGRGVIIWGWAPQVLILEHPGVGAFVTHCGWNSTLEAVSAGVPMVTWPVAAEQFYNHKFVTQILQIGIPVGVQKMVRVVGDSISSEALHKALNRIMVGEEAEAIRNRASKLAELARAAVQPNGSSYAHFTHFIQHIASIPCPQPQN
uniref:Anthocyanin 3'-O-beta-glucosyltransferase n=1 Tax=Cajanus cajan TaxID=3821 RepID=A0A151RRC2_CAJCA|nr:Anthocyanin 3'-O-beta-glucosyltransferase [Cajanus cajan]